MKPDSDRKFREDLEAKSDGLLVATLAAKRLEHAKLTQQVGIADLTSRIFKRRLRGLSGSVITGGQLERRFIQLFDAVHEYRGLWPVGEVVEVIEGVIGRVIAKRIWAAFLGLLTLLPAIVTLLFLSSQNQILVEQNRIESDSEAATLKASFLETIYQPSLLEKDGWPDNPQPRWHPRLRSEAIASLVALEKESWTQKERRALPASRYISLEDADLTNATIASDLGLLPNQRTSDASRISFDRAELTGARIFGVDISASSFRDATAMNLWLSTPRAFYTDFSGMRAKGAKIDYWDTPEHEFEFVNAFFVRTDLEGASFDSVDFEACDFEEVNLSRSEFVNIQIIDSSFENATLDGARFYNSSFYDCDMSGVDLRGLDFTNCTLGGIDITTAVIDETTKLPEDAYLWTDEGDGSRWILLDEEKYQEIIDRMAEESE